MKTINSPDRIPIPKVKEGKDFEENEILCSPPAIDSLSVSLFAFSLSLFDWSIGVIAVFPERESAS